MRSGTMRHWRAKAVGLFILGTAGAASAQPGPIFDSYHLLSHRADERLEAATLRAWYAQVGERLNAGGQGAVAQALYRARALVPASGNFETMRVRDAAALIDAHDALVTVLGLPPSERIACRR